MPTGRIAHLLGRIALLALLSCALPSCGWDGQFRILGYTTEPNYDKGIQTVRIPIFKNTTLRRELEFELTQAVIREIEAKTPFKVVSAGCDADTELTGTIVNLSKAILNRNQLNEVREGETVLAVQVVWRDLRSGEILSKPRPGTPGQPAPFPPPPPNKPGAPPVDFVTVTSQGTYIPELGESLATSRQRNVNQLAIQIVSMMEKPW